MPSMIRSVGRGLLLTIKLSFNALMFSGRTLLLVFRWGIFLLACGFLYSQVQADKGTRALDALQALPGDGRAMLLVALVGLLVFVNWGIEALKWRLLVTHLQAITFGRAFIATVAGTSIGLITPNRTGEFVGRVLFLDPEHRFAGAFATALGSIAQFVVTLVAGGLALVLLMALGHALPWPAGWYSSALVSLTALVSAGALVLYLFPGLLRHLLLLVPLLQRLKKASSVLDTYARRELLAVLGLSVLRYAVFTTQFVLLCVAFHVGTSVGTAMLAIPVVYLVSTLVPTVLLTELGVRGSAAVAFFAPLGGDEGAVLLATTLLWLLNLVLPAAAGSVLLVTARIRTAKV
jgi:uncharacterized membrane protein YbhN (UPF0104 family)